MSNWSIRPTSDMVRDAVRKVNDGMARREHPKPRLDANESFIAEGVFLNLLAREESR